MKKLCLSIITGVLAVQAHAFCFGEAAQRYGVDEKLLRAIADVESGMNSKATHVNTDGSVDIGLMMINDSWLPKLAKFDITRADLFNACTNVNVAAWILADNIRVHGHTWRAIGAYNARTESRREAYVTKVWKVLMKGHLS